MIQTNIFLIENLEQLYCKYQLYKIRGISQHSQDFERNVTQLAQSLSSKTHSPCVITKENNETFFAIPTDSGGLPESFPFGGVNVQLEKINEIRELRLDKLTDDELNIAKGFIQFSIQTPLYNSQNLWLPYAGGPFFHKTPDLGFQKLSHDVDMYKGFKFRLIVLPGNKIGICIDTARKYVSRKPLPTQISPDDFRKFKFKKCIYEYGKQWYQIRIEGLHDQTVGEFKFGENDQTLFDAVHMQAGTEKTQELLSLSKNCSVLIYHTKDGMPRHVPSGLCKLTYKTNHPAVKKLHSKTILKPHLRKSEIEFLAKTYFKDLKFQGKSLSVSMYPVDFEENTLPIPDLLFGHSTILSVSGKDKEPKTSLSQLAKTKKDFLSQPNVGFYVKKKLDVQYLVIPRSVNETFGKQFIDDLKYQMNKIYPQPDGGFYDPVVISYDDSVDPTISKLGKSILNAVVDNFAFSGYGLVMIPRLRSSRFNQEDELGNLIMRKLRDRGIFVSIMHTQVASRSYIRINNNGETNWRLSNDSKIKSRFRGYLYNVILNKILILNSCWPFVLGSSLHSDLIIGIDVKNHTAGFTLVFQDSTNRFFHSISDQKEQLSKKQLETKIYEIIKNEQSRENHPIKKITIHRDGRMFDNEIIGIQNSLDKLALDGIIDKNYEVNYVSISKTPSIPIRFFKTFSRSGSQFQQIYNPTIGTYKIFKDQALLCSTGNPYWFAGTTAPLQIIKIRGPMDYKSILEDIFFLSNLTWTKIDYCSKLPISLKMTDIRLREIAGEFNDDAFNFNFEVEEIID